MIQYQYKEKKVKFNGRDINAFFVKNHSRLKGVIFEWIDANHDDEWANISKWVRHFGIMEKGSNKWKMIEGQHPDYKWATRGLGIFSVLHGLELDNVRKKIEAEDNIVAIEKRIAELEQDLKEEKKILSKLQKSK